MTLEGELLFNQNLPPVRGCPPDYSFPAIFRHLYFETRFSAGNNTVSPLDPFLGLVVVHQLKFEMTEYKGEDGVQLHVGDTSCPTTISIILLQCTAELDRCSTYLIPIQRREPFPKGTLYLSSCSPPRIQRSGSNLCGSGKIDGSI